MDARRFVMQSYPVNRIFEFLVAALQAAGTDGESANSVATALVETSLRGVESHGIRLLTHYCTAVQEGGINPKPRLQFEQTGSGTGILDADNGFGHHASFAAIDRAIELARDSGIGAVTVIHSSHFGAAGCYPLRAAEQGFVSFATCNADAIVLPHDGVAPFHGTNPLAFAAPVPGERPFLVDMATSAIPWNRVQDLKAKELMLPESAAVDKSGQATRDPKAATALLPLGGEHFGFKGAALAGMVDVLSAVLSGMPHSSRLPSMSGPDFSTPRHLGHFFLVLDPQRFVSTELYIAGMKAYLNDLRAQPARPGTRVMAAGDREWAIQSERREHGIPIPSPLQTAFDRLADELHIQRL